MPVSPCTGAVLDRAEVGVVGTVTSVARGIEPLENAVSLHRAFGPNREYKDVGQRLPMCDSAQAQPVDDEEPQPSHGHFPFSSVVNEHGERFSHHS